MPALLVSHVRSPRQHAERLQTDSERGQDSDLDSVRNTGKYLETGTAEYK